jgi:hypothetical protein
VEKETVVSPEVYAERIEKFVSIIDMYDGKQEVNKKFVVDALDDFSIRDSLLTYLSDKELFLRCDKSKWNEERTNWCTFIINCCQDYQHTKQSASFLTAVTLLQGHWELVLQTTNQLIQDGMETSLIKLLNRATDFMGAKSVDVFSESFSNLTITEICKTTPV